jgi:hypothetical protein
MYAISLVIRHTYYSRFTLERVSETSQIFLRDTHILPKCFSYEILQTWLVTSPSLVADISGVSAINPYRLLRSPWKKGRGAILLFYPRTTRNIDNALDIIALCVEIGTGFTCLSLSTRLVCQFTACFLNLHANAAVCGYDACLHHSNLCILICIRVIEYVVNGSPSVSTRWRIY